MHFNCSFSMLARIKRIVSNEREKIAGQRSRLSQFQQKNRELRERNEALETQLAVLRRRLTEMEGEEAESRKNLVAAATLDRDRRKLNKQLEQARADVSTLQSENGRLRDELLSASQSSVSLKLLSSALNTLSYSLDIY